MRRFILPDTVFLPDQPIVLPAELVKHLRTVLRLQPGAEIELCNGCGVVAQARILALDAKGGSATIGVIKKVPASAIPLSLIQGLPKGEKIELVLQKGTELGAEQFVLTPMERSVGQLKAQRKAGRQERWRKIVSEAARQSGQPFLPQLELADNFSHALELVEADLKLMLWEEAAVPLPQLLPAEPPQRIAVVVGPEGGLTRREAQQAGDAGYQPVRLGPRILRTETAGLAIITILQYLYGDLTIGQLDSDAVFQERDES